MLHHTVDGRTQHLQIRALRGLDQFLLGGIALLGRLHQFARDTALELGLSESLLLNRRLDAGHRFRQTLRLHRHLFFLVGQLKLGLDQGQLGNVPALRQLLPHLVALLHQGQTASQLVEVHGDRIAVGLALLDVSVQRGQTRPHLQLPVLKQGHLVVQDLVRNVLVHLAPVPAFEQGLEPLHLGPGLGEFTRQALGIGQTGGRVELHQHVASTHLLAVTHLDGPHHPRLHGLHHLAAPGRHHAALAADHHVHVGKVGKGQRGQRHDAKTQGHHAGQQARRALLHGDRCRRERSPLLVKIGGHGVWVRGCVRHGPSPRLRLSSRWSPESGGLGRGRGSGPWRPSGWHGCRIPPGAPPQRPGCGWPCAASAAGAPR